MSASEYDIAIIGSGVGGLTCGALLAQQYKKVIILEKQPSVGGYASSFKRKGFIFDVAVHFAFECHEGGIIRKVLRLLNPEKEIIQFHKLDPIYKLIFPDMFLVIPADLQGYINELTYLFPQEKQGIMDLFKALNELCSSVRGKRLSAPIVQKYKEKTFQELLEDFIKDKKLQATLSATWSFNATPPFIAGALPMAMMVMDLFFQGAYYPTGGFQGFVDDLVAGLQRHGGQIRLGAEVSKIIVEDGRAVGVRTKDGEQIRARYIISNADARQTFFQLVGEDLLPQAFAADLKSLKVCPSGFNVYLGVDIDMKSVVPDLAEVVIFHTSFDYEKEYKAMGSLDLDNTCFCITAATIVDPTIAPKGKHCISIFTPAFAAPPEGSWGEHKENIANRLITLAEAVIPGLSKHILVKDAATPATFQRYTANTGGAISGWAHDPRTVFRKPQPRSPIKNLFLVGHWTLPGGGISGVATSGWNLAQLLGKR